MSSERSKHRLGSGTDTQLETPIEPRENHRELLIPNNRSGVSIVSYVDWALVELTHEPLGAEYRSSHLWGHKRTHYVAVDAYGELFAKHHHDDRLGWHEETLSRDKLRTELVNRLSRFRPETSDPTREVACRCDRFVLKPLRHRSQREDTK